MKRDSYPEELRERRRRCLQIRIRDYLAAAHRVALGTDLMLDAMREFDEGTRDMADKEAL